MTTQATEEAGHRRRLRIEDEPLLRGRGQFVADVRPERLAAAAFVRSPHAAARIRGIDAAAARQIPGVLGVFTAADMAGLGNLSTPAPIPGRNGAKMVVPEWPPLADERVLHVGQPVVLVVAETAALAQDAAEAVLVDYDVLTPVIGVAAAVTADAPQVWPEAPGNLAVDWPGPNAGDGANAREVERIIAAAPKVARVRYSHQRITAASLEPRAATAGFDAASGEYTLRCGSQSVFAMRRQLAGVLKLEPEALRVLSTDVGGAFGMKVGAYPEYPALLVAARRVGRPIHWSSSRSEAFLSDNQAREMITAAELALDDDGKFL